MIYTMTLNPALDYVMHPNTLDMGFTNRSSSEELHCGGNGINVSTLLNGLDKVTVAMGIVGGFTGEYLLSDLQRQGIPSNFVKLDSGFTRINVKLNGIVMTMVNGNGPRIPEKKVDELLERMDVVGAGDTLVLTGSIPSSLPEDIYTRLMAQLAGRGIQFVVDAPGQLLMEAIKVQAQRLQKSAFHLQRSSRTAALATLSFLAVVQVRCSWTSTALSTLSQLQRFALLTQLALVTPWLQAFWQRLPLATITTLRLSTLLLAVRQLQQAEESQSAQPSIVLSLLSTRRWAEKCLLLSQKRFSLLARKRRLARASLLGLQILSSNLS